MDSMKIPLLLISILTLSNYFFVHAQEGRSDWPQWRGPNRDGIVSHSGITHFADDYGLQIVWKKALGSGYSGISVADGRDLHNVFR